MEQLPRPQVWLEPVLLSSLGVVVGKGWYEQSPWGRPQLLLC